MSRVDINDYTAGDTIIMELMVKTPGGDAVDLTGATLTWRIATPPSGVAIGDALVTKTVGSGIVVNDAVTGDITITLTAGDFTEVGQYWHELEIVHASGESYTYMAGSLRSRAAINA